MLEMIKNVCTVIVLCEVVATFSALIMIVVENRKDNSENEEDRKNG